VVQAQWMEVHQIGISPMNERIKELIEQATTKREFYPASCNGYPEYRYDFDQEKFALLIIRECIDIVPWQYEENIKQHFGVEK